MDMLPVKVPACLVLENRKQGVEYMEIDVEEFLTSFFERVSSHSACLWVFSPLSVFKDLKKIIILWK